MNHSELIDAIAAQTEKPKATVKAILDAQASIAAGELASGNDVILQGIGKLKTHQRNAVTRHNPQNPSEKFEVPAKTVVNFKVTKSLADAVNV